MTQTPARPAVGIIGAGRQGADLTLLCLRAGLQTAVADVFPDKLRSLRQLAGQEVGEAETAGLLTFCANVEDAIRKADVVLDSVPDELESKLEIFSLVDRMAPPAAIFCSPLRETEISDLAACTTRPEYCIGVQTAVENETWLDCREVILLSGAHTSKQTLDTTSAFWQLLRKDTTVEAAG